MGEEAESAEALSPRTGPAADLPPLVVIAGAHGWADVEPHLPLGPAHVLITSTAPAAEWTPWAAVLPVGPWERSESVGFLSRNVPTLTSDDAGQLAAVLGDLPLALAYAEIWLNRGRSASSFLAMLRSRPAEVLGSAGPDGYSSSLASRIAEARDSLAAGDDWPARLLDASALLGPSPMPVSSLNPGVLFGPSEDTLSTELLLRGTQLIKAFPSVGKSGLASLTCGMLSVTPVYCAVVRGLLTSDPTASAHATRWAEVLLVALRPCPPGRDGWDARDEWRQVSPQFMAYDPLDVGTREGLVVLAAAYDHMLDMGRWRDVLHKLESLRLRGRHLLPENHAVTLRVGSVLVRAYDCAQRYSDASALGAEMLADATSAWGTRDLDTLKCASALIVPLGASGNPLRAVERATVTMAAQRDLLGSSHPETLLTLSRLAVVELMAGNWQNSATVGETALSEQQRVLGDTHPDVLATAYWLACAYAESGVYARKALDLFFATHQAQRKALGDSHPATIRTAAGFVLQDLDVYNACHDIEFCRRTLDLLRREFGAEDKYVYRIDRACRRAGVKIVP
ncbi:hypothetical protein BGM09_08105 [Streptomyces sp. CBMA29]|nr:hypothetical protein [Streptomyces sp. CBMA29]